MPIKKELIDPNTDRNMIKFREKYNFALPLIALIAIALTFISPQWSSLVYFSLLLVRRIS